MEDRYDTDIDDLWSAITDPRRLARWLGEIEGDLRPGGEYHAHYYASGWEGTVRIEICEPPRRLRLVDEADTPEPQVNEVTLTADGIRPSSSSRNVGCRWSWSLGTGPGFRSISKTSPPISPDVRGVTPTHE